jgi:Flp pilus assembly pilin Flp
MSIIKNCVWYLHQYLRGTRAVAAMEYAIIVGVVVVGVGAAVVAFQEEVKDFIEKAATDITDTRTTMEGEGEGDE